MTEDKEIFDPPLEIKTTINGNYCKISIKSILIHNELSDGETTPTDVEYELLESDGKPTEEEITNALQVIFTEAIKKQIANHDDDDDGEKWL